MCFHPTFRKLREFSRGNFWISENKWHWYLDTMVFREWRREYSVHVTYIHEVVITVMLSNIYYIQNQLLYIL